MAPDLPNIEGIPTIFSKLASDTCEVGRSSINVTAL